MDEAVARIVAAREAGAHASFIEAPTTVNELAEIGRRVPRPIVANMIEGGKTPVLPLAELARMGFHLVLYPLTGLYAAAAALERAYQALRQGGTTQNSGLPLMTFEQFNALLEVEQKYAMAQRYGA